MRSVKAGATKYVAISAELRWGHYVRQTLCLLTLFSLLGCSSSQPSAQNAEPSGSGRTANDSRVAAERLAIERERAAIERERLKLQRQQAELQKQSQIEAQKKQEADERTQLIDRVAHQCADAAVEMERKMASASNRLANSTGGVSNKVTPPQFLYQCL
jgi:hypothetical protein